MAAGVTAELDEFEPGLEFRAQRGALGEKLIRGVIEGFRGRGARFAVEEAEVVDTGGID